MMCQEESERTRSRQHAGWTINFPAFDTQVGVELRRIADWRLSVDQLKQTRVTQPVVLAIQHHYNKHRQTMRQKLIITVVIITTEL